MTQSKTVLCEKHPGYQAKARPRARCLECWQAWGRRPTRPAPEEVVEPGAPRPRARVVLFDIETQNLKADFGWLLCGAWKVLGEKKVHCVTIADFPRAFREDPTNDRHVVERYCRELSNADVWVSWYGQRFDEPFLNSRLVYHGLPPMPKVPHVDGWRLARYNLALSSNRLANVQRFLQLPEAKTAIEPTHWRRVVAGHKPSLRYIVEHCKKDVEVLEMAYLRLRSLSATHPNVCLPAAVDGCPQCGVVGKMIRDGRRIARTGIAQRYRCGACGGRSQLKYDRVKEVNLR